MLPPHRNPTSGPDGPPRWAHRLLTWLHPEETLEEVEGDLNELYAYWHQRAGKTQATLRYVLNVVSVLPPFVRRRQQKQDYHQPSILQLIMIRNYLKIAWRNLRKQPGFTAINVFGLSAGLTCFAFIALWVNDELSYDRFNRNYDRIVRLTTTEHTEIGITESARTGAPVAKALLDNYAEIENTVRLRKHGEIVQYRNQQTLQPDILLTEPSFFTVFSYGLVRGNAATALRAPYSVVLTESTAKQYFGDADPMGQVLTIFMYDSTGRGANYTVTGITPDPPKNAHFTFTMLGSFKTAEVTHPDLLTTAGWTDTRFYTYLLLKKGVDPETFANKIDRFYASYRSSPSNTGHADLGFKLQPLRDIHLRSRLDHEIAPTGNVQQVSIFSTIGLFILLLASINYTNLATARSAGRAKEVSVKKVVGALKTEIVVQYLVESVFTATLALLLSGLLALVLQPFFQSFTGKVLSLFSSPFLLLFLTGVTFVVGILSGLYPAFVLSSFKPASVLKGAFRLGTKGILLRQSLVISQFVITLLLISSIVIIYAQMRYVRHKDLGYDKSALLFVSVNGNADVVNGYQAFKHDVSASPLIAGITTSNSMIFNGLDAGDAQTTDEQGKIIPVTTARLQVDANYLTVYGVKLLVGTNFSTLMTSDSIQPILLNESAVRRFGWKNAQTAIGKPFTMDGQPGTVVGVVHDFHFNSLQHTIEPLAISRKIDYFSKITFKIDARQASQSLVLIKTAWADHFPGALLEYGFFDSELAAQYQAEERFSAIVTGFSILSLVIACLGLYGLIAYATAQRTKEIGIRKTLGASVNGIVVLLSKDFLKLVFLASFIAIPVAWYVMSRWLQNFAYKVTLAWWMFAASVLLVLVVALLTVSYQSIKVALMNPVKSLRSE